MLVGKSTGDDDGESLLAAAELVGWVQVVGGVQPVGVFFDCV